MDDSCAVCAESLEWVAYGGCGHKDICSTCVARLRFICDDRRCCICKTDCDVIFVTKALGDYTKTISDFGILPSEAKEGRVGKYWYHEDTQAFFDDLDHYKMIKAMCRLSCSVCDNKEDQLDDGSRRRAKFRNIEQLKGHLFHRHKLFMCSLCLEGRKVFICEQKLYTRSQLTQHINTGDSEVDGDERERGGFAGHPMCEFCHTPFYGDNELYTHMSTEHYTCHICQRQHPGQYEYYSNYDDLEMHFRRDHFLCEDEGCLGKKFIVFQSEGELKRHNTLEHGGRMSRAQRSAALQIPTSFRYRRSNEQDNHRGRGRTFRRDTVDNELSLAIQASLETATASASNDHANTSDVESLAPPVESSGTTDSSRYRQAVSSSSRSGTLVESSFPPLSMASGSNQPNPNLDVRPKNTMAARLRDQGNRKVNVLNSASAWPAASNKPVPQATAPHAAWPPINGVSGSSSSSNQLRPVASSSYSALAQTSPQLVGESRSSNSGRTSGITHSSSAPNLSVRGSLISSDADFPPVSVLQTQQKPPPTDQAVIKAEDVHSANKSLVEKMRAALGSDEDKLTAFKAISGEYRQGSMDVETYLAHVEQFNLTHLVLDLARLLPNYEKQKELIDAYNRNTLSKNALQDNQKLSKGGAKKGKGKSIESGSSSAGSNLADNIINAMKELQASYHNTPDGEVEVLSKDGYRAGTGKSKAVAHNSPAEPRGPGESSTLKTEVETSTTVNGSNQSSVGGDVKGKQRKKTSKFHRVRLGDGSMEARLNLSSEIANLDEKESVSSGASNPSGSFPAHGVWGRGGGQKLLSMSSREPKSRV